MCQRHAPATLPPGKRLSTHSTGGWVGQEGSVGVRKIFGPTAVQTPDRPALSQSYRLRTPGHYYYY